MNSLLRLLVVFIPMLCFLGCNSEGEYFYNITAYNQSGHAMDNVKIQFGEQPITFGIIVKDGSKGEVAVNYPIPRKATVSWDDEKGGKHVKEIEVAKNLSKNLNRKTIQIIVNPNEEVIVSAK